MGSVQPLGTPLMVLSWEALMGLDHHGGEVGVLGIIFQHLGLGFGFGFPGSTPSAP
jgi:hypothetical protein